MQPRVLWVCSTIVGISGAAALGQTPGDDAIRATVAEMLADAQTRASLLEGGPTSGYDKGFFIGSEDGNFRLVLNGSLQIRYLNNLRDEDPAPAGKNDDYTHGFTHARIRLAIGGHLGDKTWKYYINSGAGPDGQYRLQDAWVRKDINKHWYVQGGVIKAPLIYEWLMSDRVLQVVERSFIEARFSPGYVDGVLVGAQYDQFRFMASFNDGLKSQYTDLLDGAGNQAAADWAATGRLEWKPLGEWSDYTDFQSFRGGKPLLVLAGAIHGQDGKDASTNSERSIVRWTFDANWKLGGANLFAMIVGSHEDTGLTTSDKLGAMLQGGVFVSDPLELFARYEWGDLDGEGLVSDELSVATVGFNYFFAKHAHKLSADIGYAFEPLDSKWSGGTSRGWIADAPGADGQTVVRVQLQMLF
jgi:hypothetical protein